MANCQRVIIVPNDKGAMEALDLGVDYVHQCSLYCVPPSHYTALWKSGVFEMINGAIGSLIDEYESELVVGKDRILRALECVEQVEATYTGDHGNAFVMLRGFLLLAIDCGTGIDFSF